MATVVLVDDESSMRSLLGEYLRRKGHDIVAEAGDMEAAKEIVRRYVNEDITPVFVIDGAFPIQGQGKELAQIIRQEIPRAKIISLSGNLQGWGDKNLLKGRRDAFLELLNFLSSISSGQT